MNYNIRIVQDVIYYSDDSTVVSLRKNDIYNVQYRNNEYLFEVIHVCQITAQTDNKYYPLQHLSKSMYQVCHGDEIPTIHYYSYVRRDDPIEVEYLSCIYDCLSYLEKLIDINESYTLFKT